MPTRKELQKLARLRLKEAETLFDNGLYDGCVYLAGYVLELALKARICRILKVNDYPDSSKDSDIRRTFQTHDFERLQYLAVLELDLQNADPNLVANWGIVEKWEPKRRYSPVGTWQKQDAADVLTALKDKPYGVLTWISRRW